MQGKWSEVRNFTSEERKQSNNHCLPVKLESKKNDKKIIDPGRDRARTLPAIVEKNLSIFRKQKNSEQLTLEKEN